MNDASGNYNPGVPRGDGDPRLHHRANIFLKGFFSIIPILIGLVAGYIFSLIVGFISPAHATLIDFTVVHQAAWFGLPTFAVPKFNLVATVTFVIVSLATICEHLGDTITISKVVGEDYLVDPGLHRTLIGDGLASLWASLWGGPPNTTYGENVGVLALTRVYSVWVTGGAAVISVLLSFFPKFGALIQTIPSPVLGGISMLLFGIIASSGLRTLVDSGVDYEDKRISISSVILVIGIGAAFLCDARSHVHVGGWRGNRREFSSTSFFPRTNDYRAHRIREPIDSLISFYRLFCYP